MKSIYKYEIPPGGGELELPAGAKILSVGVQKGALTLWVEVCLKQTHTTRRIIEVFATGEEFPYGGREFIGTVFVGPYVWHVYEYLGV